MASHDAQEQDALKAAARQDETDSLRFEWRSSFGLILIEVRDGLVYVNGERVEPADKTGSR